MASGNKNIYTVHFLQPFYTSYLILTAIFEGRQGRALTISSVSQMNAMRLRKAVGLVQAEQILKALLSLPSPTFYQPSNSLLALMTKCCGFSSK